MKSRSASSYAQGAKTRFINQEQDFQAIKNDEKRLKELQDECKVLQRRIDRYMLIKFGLVRIH